MNDKKIRGTNHVKNRSEKRAIRGIAITSAIALLLGVSVFTATFIAKNIDASKEEISESVSAIDSGILVERNVENTEYLASGGSGSSGTGGTLGGRAANGNITVHAVLFDSTGKVKDGIAFGQSDVDNIHNSGSTDKMFELDPSKSTYFGNGYERGDQVCPTVYVYRNGKEVLHKGYSDYKIYGDTYRKAYASPIDGGTLQNGDMILITVNNSESAKVPFDWKWVEVANANPSMGTVSGGGKKNTQDATTFQITATSADDTKYEFDYWEYYDTDGTVRQLKEASTTVTEKESYRLYTAHFKDKTYDMTYKVNGPVEGVKSVVFSPQEVKAGSDCNFTITLEDGFKLVKWSYKQKNKDEQSGTGNTGTISNVTENMALNVTIEDSRKVIRAGVNATGRGSVKITDESVDPVKSDGSTLKVPAGHKVSITAEANDGYKLKDWKDESNNYITGNPLIISSVSEDKTYTANFIGNSVDVTFVTPSVPNDVSSPTINASYTVTYIGDDGNQHKETFSEGKTIKVQSETDITIHAESGNESLLAFDKFIVTEGDGSQEYKNDSVIADITKNKKVQAIFKGTSYKIAAKASPTTAGSFKFGVNGGSKQAESSVTVKYGDNVSIEATAKDGYTFRHWEDETGKEIDDGDDKKYILNLTNIEDNATYTAVFYKETSTITTKGNPSEGGLEITYTPPGSSTSITAAAYGKYNVKSEAGIKLTWKPKTGASVTFVGVRDSSNNLIKPDTAGGAVISLPVIHDETYTVVTDETPYTITAQTSPELGGYVLIDGKKTFTKTVHYDADVRLQAVDAGDYKFAYWTDQNGNRINERIITVDMINGDVKYIAHFVKNGVGITLRMTPNSSIGDVAISYQIASGSNIGRKVTEHGTGYYVVSGKSTYTIEADEKSPEYHFVEFVDDLGNHYSANPLTVTSASDDRTYTAVFSKDENIITVVNAPTNGGVARINNVVASERSVDFGSDVSLTAYPNPGYDFKNWTDQNGTIYYDSHIEFKSVSGDMKFTAHYTKQKVDITVKIAQGDSTTYIYFDNHPSSKPITTYKNVDSGTHMFEAHAEYGMKFIRWQTDDGKTYTENPLSLANIENNMTITAVFEPVKYEIKVAADPVSGGIVSVDFESLRDQVDENGDALIIAIPADGYKFVNFTDSKGNKYEGEVIEDENTYYLLLSNINGDETYTAHFVRESSSITLDVTPEGAGIVKLDDRDFIKSRNSYTVDTNSNHTITAQSLDKNKYQFLYWQDSSGKTYNNNPLELVDVKVGETYTAVFKSRTSGLKVVCSPALGGRIKKTTNDDGSVTVKVTANKGYSFKGWKKEGSDNIISSSETIEISAEDANKGETYVATFKYNKDYNAKSDITEEKFYKDGRKDNGVNYTETKESMKARAEKEMASAADIYKDSAPDLKSHSAVSSAKSYYDNKASNSGTKEKPVGNGDELYTVEGEDVNTNKSEISSSVEEKVKQYVTNKFGDRYKYEVLTSKKTAFSDGFDNVNRTYLWENTGAKKKDNIVILYKMNDKKISAITPIVDEDGVLKFTMPELMQGEILTVVRVKVGD